MDRHWKSMTVWGVALALIFSTNLQAKTKRGAQVIVERHDVRSCPVHFFHGSFGHAPDGLGTLGTPI